MAAGRGECKAPAAEDCQEKCQRFGPVKQGLLNLANSGQLKGIANLDTQLSWRQAHSQIGPVDQCKLLLIG